MLQYQSPTSASEYIKSSNILTDDMTWLPLVIKKSPQIFQYAPRFTYQDATNL